LATYNSTWKHRWAIAQRIAAKRFFKLLGKRNASMQPATFFSIKPGYHHATSSEQLDATLSTDEWQKEVYQLAADLAKQSHHNTILDVGCGSGYKLVNMLGDFDTTGIEVNPTYEWLKKNYPHKEWLLFDEVLNPGNLETDMVLCADVIEHLANPDDLLDFISDINFKILVISTPERDAVAGNNDFGPPENTAHFREWNAVEFKNYLRRWFVVKEQQIFNTKSVTQVVICEKKLV
jgi:SAM-dependent methyltransferase